MFFNGYIASTDLIAVALVVIFGLLALVRRQGFWWVAATIVLVVWAVIRFIRPF
ncbi:hypothetical protein LJ725_01340 [Reyranella aquatilis]|uniref:Uncharacterized protein n=1 Tax=Reyranella aquatilis TaxID=2035356 RepID=A0ABS8KNF2_9HYPH|nr:hypothetical protein [Reyranella aquatilis]MCC8427592.1 hypothetical protein [Reyranella aquatilis]